MPRAKRGEIWMADLGLAAKVRPVLVLSVAYEGQERAIVSYVIRTTSLRSTQYEVPHTTARCLTAGLRCRLRLTSSKYFSASMTRTLESALKQMSDYLMPEIKVDRVRGLQLMHPL